MPTARADRFLPALRRVVLVRETADRPDAELLGAFARDRDADAFAGLVRRHGPMVLGVCRRVVGDHHAADDAFQAVFLVLARRAAAVRPRSAVGNWLYGVAYRTAIKARAVLARRRSREKQVDAMPEPPAPRPDARVCESSRIAGGPPEEVGSLVSAHAVQLSEGVMRMMLLAKLRAVGAAALTAVALTTGLGLGLAPAAGQTPGADPGGVTPPG